MGVSNVYHLFSYVSTDYIQEKWHTKVTKAAWISSLESVFAMVFSPLMGLLSDWVGFRMLIVAGGSALTSLAYMLLCVTDLWPVTPILILSFCKAFMPTILRSSVPLVVLPAVYGAAYGMYEISESVGSLIGNPLVGFFRDHTHSYETDLWVFVGMAFFCIGLALVIHVVDHIFYGKVLTKKAANQRPHRVPSEDHLPTTECPI
eukprot:Colp12_sorted_trinity150504_noHs@15428